MVEQSPELLHNLRIVQLYIEQWIYLTCFSDVRSKLPSVTYVKAIDIWLFFAQGTIFLTLLEYLLLHGIINGYLNPRVLQKLKLSRYKDESVQTLVSWFFNITVLLA